MFKIFSEKKYKVIHLSFSYHLEEYFLGDFLNFFFFPKGLYSIENI